MPGSPELNHRLEQIELRAKSVFRTWLAQHEEAPPTVQELQGALRDTFHRQVGQDVDHSFFGFIRTYIESSTSRTNPKTGRPPTEGTIKKYRTTLRRLEEFSRDTKTNLTWESIDLKFYDAWTDWMRQKLDLATNTVGKHIQTLKAFLNAATDEGINTNRIFQSGRFRSVSEEADSISLNEDELEALQAMDLSSEPRLERVRDVFLVGAWTGLRFSDLDQVKPENISEGKLKVRQSKTDQDVVIAVFPIVEQILAKYDGQLPSGISNQKFNEYLKEACRLCPELFSPVTLRMTKGGKKTKRRVRKADVISTHTARRSFASNLYRRGVQSITIMAMTGHRTEKQFLKYIKIGAEEHAEILAESWGNKA